MADEPKDEVKIYPPDRSLHNKIGNANLDQILSPQIVEGAQKAIGDSSEEFWQESLKHLAEIGKAYKGLIEDRQNPEKYLKPLRDESFSMKVSSGLGGFQLVSLLSKSLNKQCDALKDKQPTQKNLDIMRWHIDSIRQLLSGKVMGDGGMAGVSIAAELERLSGLK